MGIISNKRITSQLSRKELTAPSGQPVTRDEQKLYSRIDGTFEDSLIDILISAATKKSEQYVRGGFLRRTYRQIEDAGENQNPFVFAHFLFGNQIAIEIKNTQVTSIENFSIFDTDDNEIVIAPSNFRLDRADDNQPARIVFNIRSSILTSTRYFTQYKLDYTAGYPDVASVPDDIKLAIMTTTGGYYENRETMKNISPLARNLLMPYRILEL